jgi:hypothetical protein
MRVRPLLLGDKHVSVRERTYWLSGAARLRRKDDSLVFELAEGTRVPVPVTDIADIAPLRRWT